MWIILNRALMSLLSPVPILLRALRASVVNCSAWPHLSAMHCSCSSIRRRWNRATCAWRTSGLLPWVRSVTSEPGDEIVDCGGAVLMPGLVNGHTHLYSALAAGHAGAAAAAAEFSRDSASSSGGGSIGRTRWKASKSAARSARWLPSAAARRRSSIIMRRPMRSTAASPRLESGIAAVGCRGVLCYEVTDRNRPRRSAAGPGGK